VGREQQGGLFLCLDGLARALKNWCDSRNGRRKGRPIGFPTRKKKGRAPDTCRFTTGAIKVLPDRKHIQLPRIGVLKTQESTRKLARRLDCGTARILAATLSRQADRWFVSFTVEVERAVHPSNKTSIVGVDVGVRNLAVLSNGAPPIPNPRALEHSLRKLRRVSRELSRRQFGSKRRQRTRYRLARIHARAANLRRDALHKVTTNLATEFGTLVIEDLNIAGLLCNRRLARALTDAGLRELRRMLTYKCHWYGSRLVVVDRFFPSSKRCSACGWVKAKLTLDERTFNCTVCGVALDRDLNAARNLAKLVADVAQSGWETRNARGVDVRPSFAGQTTIKREAGSGHRPWKASAVGVQALAPTIEMASGS